MLLGYFVSTVNMGVARQWQPRGGRNADPAELIYSVALGGEHDVEVRCFGAASVEIEVGVDRPEGGWTQFGRQMIGKAVVDVQVEVEPVAWDSVQFAGLEVLNFDETIERTVAINADCVGPEVGIEDECNTSNGHGSAPRNK